MHWMRSYEEQHVYLEDWQLKFAGDPDVKSVERAPTMFNNGSYLKKAVLIIMADGTRVAGCTWDGCTELAEHTTTIITKHWRTHTGEKVQRHRPKGKGAAYADLTFQEMADALAAADTKVKRAEAARDRALQQLDNMREANRDVIADLRVQVTAAEEELDRVKAAVRTLYPGALG